MKNIKLVACLFFILTAFTFTSCENEPIDSAINLDDFNNGGGGTSTGDYWPTALNNQWVYKLNGVQQSPMKIISVNSIDNATYYTFDTLFGQGSAGSVGNATVRLRKNSGDYYIRIEDLNLNLGSGLTATMTGYEYILLKDYLTVGQTWTGTYNQTTTYSDPQLPAITHTTSYTGTVVETGLSLTVNGTSFPNVIKVRVRQSTSFPGSPEPSVVDSDYWFAKDVGPIKAVNLSTVNGNTTTNTNDLFSFILN